MKVKPHVLYVQDDETGLPTGRLLAYVGPASNASVALVLERDENDGDGRSNWVWLRLQNGDLVLGVFPQGDTYFGCEEDAAAAERLACEAGAL